MWMWYVAVDQDVDEDVSVNTHVNLAADVNIAQMQIKGG